MFGAAMPRIAAIRVCSVIMDSFIIELFFTNLDPAEIGVRVPPGSTT
jgi:hypothetical protein